MGQGEMFRFLSPPIIGDETYTERVERLEWENKYKIKEEREMKNKENSSPGKKSGNRDYPEEWLRAQEALFEPTSD